MEVSPTLYQKIKFHFSQKLNLLDLLIFVLFILSIILRWTLPSSTFVWARIFYVITLTLFILRFLRVFFVSKNVGPKVIIIGGMVGECLRLTSK